MKLTVREYLRVSKDRSGHGKSPDEQHKENVRAIESRGWQLHPSGPYKDIDRSASEYARREREGYQRLVADLKTGRFGADVLCLWESSRGSRRVDEWLELIGLCQDAEVGIFVTTHGRLYDPANARDWRSMLEDAVDAGYESKKTSERIQRSVRAAAEAGKVHGKEIWGYRRIYDQRTRELVRIEVDPVNGPWVQEMAKRVLRGDSFYSVAKALNLADVPTRRPSKDGKRIPRWTGTAVKQTLSMPAYTGLRKHHDALIETDEWPALIERDDFEKIQRILFDPSRKRDNNWPARHLLSGIARCAECNGKLRIQKQNRGKRKDKDGNPLPRPKDEDGNELPYPFYYSYVCRGSVDGSQHVPGKKGFHIGIKCEHLDTMVTELVLARLERPDFLVEVGNRGEDVDARRKELGVEIAQLQQYLDQVREAAAEELDMTVLLDQERRIRPKIAAAQKELEGLSEVDPEVIDLAKSGTIRKVWAEWSKEGNQEGLVNRRRIIQALGTPLVSRSKKPGQRGMDFDRVEFVWN